MVVDNIKFIYKLTYPIAIMKIEYHKESFKEHKEAIFRFALDILGIENSQRIIGLHASRGILDLLSIYLLERKKISTGMQLNHRWFKSKKVSEKLPEFNNKEMIINKLVELELKCERLSYGARKSVKEIEEAIKMFTELEKEFKKMKNEKK